MSRYFELMQTSERDQAAQARERGEPVPLSSTPSMVGDSFETGLQWAGTSHPLEIIPHPQLRQTETARVSFLRFLAEACFRHPRSFLGIAGATLLITAMAVWVTPERYQATMQMAIANRGQYAVGGSDSGDRVGGGITEGDANAQAELLRSRDSLSQALDLVGAPASTALARDEQIDALGRNLEVARVPGSNLLQLSYRASSPERAKDVLQAVASSFVNRELALLHPPRQPILADLVDQRQHELTAAQQDIASFEGTTGIASLGEAASTNPPGAQSAAADPWQERVAAAQRNLALATQKRDQAAVDDAVEKERVRSVAIAAKPSASSIPVQPQPVLYCVSGLVGAMFLSVGFCAFAERKRTTVYSPVELELLTGVTTLATVPMQKIEVQK